MKRIVIAIFLILTALSLSSFCQGWNVGLVGSINSAWWQANSIAVQDTFAYMTYQTAPYIAHLGVIDIADPINPQLIGTFSFTSAPFDLAVQDSYAYVADDGQGLKVIDISDPQNPSMVYEYDLQELAYCVSVSGNYAYVGYNHFSNTEVCVCLIYQTRQVRSK